MNYFRILRKFFLHSTNIKKFAEVANLLFGQDLAPCWKKDHKNSKPLNFFLPSRLLEELCSWHFSYSDAEKAPSGS